MKVIFILENKTTYLNTNPKGEPQLGKRELYSMISGKEQCKQNTAILLNRIAIFWVLNLSDGTNSLLDISIRSGISFDKIKETADILLYKGLLKSYVE